MNNIKEDKVNHPSHYTWLEKTIGVEVIQITEQFDFCIGNALKYILRAGRKEENGYNSNEKYLEDLKKARWYLDRKISSIENNKEEYPF